MLNTSIATGAMALTPEHAWIYLVICRLFVGFGVTGMYSVDITIIQEFAPSARRGWLTGLTTTMLPAGFLLGALLSAFATPYIGWRGLFAVGLLPAFLTLYIRAWVPESPYWLMRMGRFEEARRSLAWALQIDPKAIELPALTPAAEHTRWRELFKYPRSIFAGALTRLPGTSGLGASRNATGSSTPRSRQAWSNARRSDATIKGTPASPNRPAGLRRCAAKSSCCQTEITVDLLLWPCHASPGRCLPWSD